MSDEFELGSLHGSALALLEEARDAVCEALTVATHPHDLRVLSIMRTKIEEALMWLVHNDDGWDDALRDIDAAPEKEEQSDDEYTIDWSVSLEPCSNTCIMGRPKGMAPSGGCAHLQLTPQETTRLLRRVAHSRLLLLARANAHETEFLAKAERRGRERTRARTRTS